MGVEYGVGVSLLEDLTVQAVNTHTIHQGCPGLLDVHCAHAVGSGVWNEGAFRMKLMCIF